MKKILYILLVVLLFSGCSNLSNTPKKKTEEFLKKYQTLDNVVLNDLDAILASDATMDNKQKEVYKEIMKKHYQGLMYEIKDAIINGDDAVVTVEITVTDFNKVLDESSRYLSEHLDEFTDEFGEYDSNKYTTYRLEQLKNAKEKVKYTLNISLSKINDEWGVDEQSQTTYDKINGIYNY